LVKPCGIMWICMINLRAKDVYDALDTVVVTFVANLPKISILIFLLGTVQHGSQTITEFSWTNVFLVSSFLSLIVGTVGGLVQFRIKRLLAYSSISHNGFLLLALVGLSLESVQGFLFYLSQYILTSICVFFILVLIGHSLKDRKINYELLDREHSPLQFIAQLKGYFYHNPILALSLAISLFSLLGIPPLIGFYGKQLVLSAALQEGHVFLCIIAILTSVVGGVYYLQVIKAMFFLDGSEEGEYPSSENTQLKNKNKNKNSLDLNFKTLPSSSLTITVSTLTLINLLFILCPNIWLSSANILAMLFLNI